MRTLRRLLYARDREGRVLRRPRLPVAVLLLRLRGELGKANDKGYTALHAAVYSMLFMPGHLYELIPIAVLIGTIYALASLAQSSEFTIMRTAGLGPGRALVALAGLGVAFAVFTFVLGDYLAPLSETQAASFKAAFSRQLQARPRRRVAEGPAHDDRRASAPTRSTSAAADAGGLLRGVRIFEFDADGRLLSRIAAATGTCRCRRQLALDRRPASPIGRPPRRGRRKPVRDDPASATWSGRARSAPTCRRCGGAAARDDVHARPVALYPPPASNQNRPRNGTRSSSGSGPCIRSPAW